MNVHEQIESHDADILQFAGGTLGDKKAKLGSDNPAPRNEVLRLAPHGLTGNVCELGKRQEIRVLRFDALLAGLQLVIARVGVPGACYPRIADQKPVMASISEQRAWLQSEQTIIVSVYGAFVVNNLIGEGHPGRIIDVLTVGPVHAPPHGVEKIVWNDKENRFYWAWACGDAVSVRMVPLASSGANAVFVNGYSTAGGWEVTGLDGRRVARYPEPSSARTTRAMESMLFFRSWKTVTCVSTP